MSTAAGARVTLLSQWVRFAIQLGGFVLLSRLLSPADFGVFAMVSVIVAFASLVADFGLSLAGLQAPSLSQRQKSSLFYANLVAGIVGALLLVAAGPVLALFYNEPEVVSLSLLLAVPLVLSSAAVQFRVEINRAGRFRALAIQDVVSAGGGLAVAVCAALAGWGFWALGVQLVAQAAIVLVLAVSQARWMPTLAGSWAESRGLLAFGGNSLLNQLAYITSRSVDAMMVGRDQGATDLGLYNRSTQLVNMAFQQLVSPLTRVVLPRLTSTAKDLPIFMRELLGVQTVVAYSMLAVVSAMAALAPPLVVTVFGEDWAGMGSLVQILCIGAAFQSVGYVYYWVMLARGRTALLLFSELPGRAVMVVGALVCAQISTNAVAWAVTLGQVVIFAGSSLTLRRAGVSSAPLIGVAVRPAVVFVVAFSVGVAVAALVQAPPWVEGVAIAAAWALSAAAALAVPTVRSDVVAAIAVVRGRSSLGQVR